MKGLVAFFFLLLAHGVTLARGLSEPIDFRQEEAEEDLSWEEALPPLLPAKDAEDEQM